MSEYSVHTIVFRSLKRSHDMFLSNREHLLMSDEKCDQFRKKIKARDLYGDVFNDAKRLEILKRTQQNHENDQFDSQMEIDSESENLSKAIVPKTQITTADMSSSALLPMLNPSSAIAMEPQTRKAPSMPKPNWHPPWKLYRVIAGHLGWVRCAAFEPGNEWFATGANDRIIKIWDLAKGQLKVSLTGHVSTVRGVAVSQHHPYLFSCGEDKQVKCWDLECNKVVRHYHGHLSAVHSLDLHPNIDVLVTAGRDSTVRVWDMRTKANIHVLSGHTNTVASVVCQAAEPQIISASHDTTLRLWDLAAGKTICTLTNHKKSVRSVVIHPKLYTFASASPDNIKEWKCPDGKFIQTLSGHNAIINTLAVNSNGVLASGGDNGSLYLWDWKTGYNFQRLQAAVQPGSMDSEAGIFSLTFDRTGTRLISTEADKTIKIYKEDDSASEETHPINWRPDLLKRKRF